MVTTIRVFSQSVSLSQNVVMSAYPSVSVSLLRGFVAITRRQLWGSLGQLGGSMGDMKIADNPKKEDNQKIKTASKMKITLKIKTT